MRRLVSSPDAVGNLTFQDTEVPTPKANECLIRVKAFSMNRGELKRSQNETKCDEGWQIEGLLNTRKLTLERQFFLDDFDSLSAEAQRQVTDLVAGLKASGVITPTQIDAK